MNQQKDLYSQPLDFGQESTNKSNRNVYLIREDCEPSGNTPQSSNEKSIGLNPLIAAADSLLLLMTHLKKIVHLPESSFLRTQILQEIKVFEETAQSSGYTPRTVLAARYCLCTALDEFVLSTEWGTNSSWAQQTLLSLIHKETWGGERFFIILEKMAETHKQHLDFLELIYLILSLGYEGKYYNQDRMVLEEIRHRLFHLIKIGRGTESLDLLLSYSQPSHSMEEKKSFFVLWAIPCIVLLLLPCLWIFFNFLTYRQAEPILQLLDNTTQKLTQSQE